MIFNYLKIAWRNVLKNKLSSIINISGLSMAVGCCLVVFIYLDWFVNQDDFHQHINNIYVIERVIETEGEQKFVSETPVPLGVHIIQDFPQIKDMARIDYTMCMIKQGDNVYRENISQVDDAFYNIFDFPIKWGDESTFTDPDGIVLTEELSTRLFGQENSIGKNVNVRLNKEEGLSIFDFTVKGVLEKRPKASSFFFSALIPLSRHSEFPNLNTDDWSQSTDITFIQTTDIDAKPPSAQQCEAYLDLYNKANKDYQISAFHFQSLKDMPFHSYKLNYSRFNNTHPFGLIMLACIALGIFLLVCFNYMNIAIASASGRFREIGVRKVLGGKREQIVAQFLIENALICIAGVFLGVVLANGLFIPWFSDLAGLDLSSRLFSDIKIWVALISLSVLAVFGGAAYPAMFISAYKPVGIIKNQLTTNSKNRFRKVLLSFQFFITFLGISMALAFVRENKMSRAKPWGYDPSNNVVVNLQESQKYSLLKTEIEVEQLGQITGSVQSLGRGNKQIAITIDGQEENVKSLQVVGGFASHFGIQVDEGRDLLEYSENDAATNALVNETFVKDRNWTTAVGRTFHHNNKTYTVVGVLKDFRFETFEHSIEPLVITGCNPEDVNYAYIQTAASITSSAHGVVENLWKKAFPNLPFVYAYQDNAFDNYYIGFTQIIQLLSAASLIMILVSICGIFGLALLILARKMKELSIRKVLGANMASISFQIFKEFLLAIIVAFVAGVPVSWFLTSSIFREFAPDSYISFVPLLIGLIAIVIMTLLSISWHLYKAYLQNPVIALRSE